MTEICTTLKTGGEMNNTHYDIVKQGHDAVAKWRVEHPADILDLRGANLTDAYLKSTDLTGADLWNATLKGANLSGANLKGANMWDTVGNSREIKTVQTDLWAVTYTVDGMQIGCQRHAIKDWWDFDDATISAMDSRALGWWRRWKPILQQIIVTSPATPTN